VEITCGHNLWTLLEESPATRGNAFVSGHFTLQQHLCVLLCCHPLFFFCTGLPKLYFRYNSCIYLYPYNNKLNTHIHWLRVYIDKNNLKRYYGEQMKGSVLLTSSTVDSSNSAKQLHSSIWHFCIPHIYCFCSTITFRSDDQNQATF